MKKFLVILSIMAVFVSCNNRKENQFLITGSVQGVDTGMVYLEKSQVKDWIKVDSVKLKHGEFRFLGSTPMPQLYGIQVAGKPVRLMFFAENSDIKIKMDPDSIDRSQVTGSASQDVFKEFKSKMAPIEKQMSDLDTKYQKAKTAHDTAGIKKIDSSYNLLEGQSKNIILDFAKTYHHSVVASYVIMKNAWQFELPELKTVAAAIDSALDSSVYVIEMKKRIKILDNVDLGKQAPDFTLNDTTGKPVTLSSLRGKYLLVDFWASWCSSCRAENPNVVKVYQAYKYKGFDILGVSFDKDRSHWINAIKADGLTWIQISDLKGWDNQAGRLYGILSIPSNVLLDKDQKIIARNLQGEDLQKKLAELLGPPSTTPNHKNKKK
ncbi:MAG: TlpA disulfide reductase family protein [Bacteroidota bacterium]|nr:TlpA disulfide reductase family protein [Bacteroidota bacterium]